MKSKKRGRGRPPGQPNRRTTAIGATLDAAHARVTRALLDEVIPDRQLAQLLWKLALEGDGRVATYLADRKWGRVKFELEHQGPEQIVLHVGLDLEYPGMPGFPVRPEQQLLPSGEESPALEVPVRPNGDA